MNRLAYTVPEAAAEVGVSPALIHKALRATDPTQFPPPLRSKRLGRGEKAKHLIPGDELARWFASFPDA